MATTTTPDPIPIRNALPSDIPSLITIIPRAYDADAFLNKIFPPESTVISDWWTQVYGKAIATPSYRILVAVSDASSEVIGVLTLHLHRPPELLEQGGLCTLIPLTADHHEALKNALVEQASDREKFMEGSPNFQVDLLGVSREFQSRGIGRALVQRACEIADQAGAAVFLQTTKAREWYLGLGLGFVSDKVYGDVAGGVVVRHAVDT